MIVTVRVKGLDRMTDSLTAQATALAIVAIENARLLDQPPVERPKPIRSSRR